VKGRQHLLDDSRAFIWGSSSKREDEEKKREKKGREMGDRKVKDIRKEKTSMPRKNSTITLVTIRQNKIYSHQVWRTQARTIMGKQTCYRRKQALFTSSPTRLIPEKVSEKIQDETDLFKEKKGRDVQKAVEHNRVAYVRRWCIPADSLLLKKRRQAIKVSIRAQGKTPSWSSRKGGARSTIQEI